MFQFLACDHKWLCYHSLVTLHCLLLVGLRIYFSGFTSHCEGRSEHTAGWLLQLSCTSPGSKSFILGVHLCLSAARGLHGYECAPKTLIHSETAKVLWGWSTDAPAEAEKDSRRPFSVYKHLMGGCKEQAAQLTWEVCGGRTRCDRHKLQDGKLQLDVGKAFLPWMSSDAGGYPEHRGHFHLGNVQNLARQNLALSTGSSWMCFTWWGRLETSRVTKIILWLVTNPTEGSKPRRWIAFFLWLGLPPCVDGLGSWYDQCCLN